MKIKNLGMLASVNSGLRLQDKTVKLKQTAFEFLLSSLKRHQS